MTKTFEECITETTKPVSITTAQAIRNTIDGAPNSSIRIGKHHIENEGKFLYISSLFKNADELTESIYTCDGNRYHPQQRNSIINMVASNKILKIALINQQTENIRELKNLTELLDHLYDAIDTTSITRTVITPEIFSIGINQKEIQYPKIPSEITRRIGNYKKIAEERDIIIHGYIEPLHKATKTLAKFKEDCQFMLSTYK